MEDELIYKDSLMRIMELCRTTFQGRFTSFYEGDPIMIPDASMPCIIIEKVKGNVTVKNAPTGTDAVSEQIVIKLVLNKANDFGASDDFDMTERKLRRYVEARDPTTGYFMSNTLMYVLRTNITLGESVIDSDVDVAYDLQPRPEKLVTSEAKVTIVIRERVQVPNRL